MLDWDRSKVQYDWCPYKKREIRTQTYIHGQEDYEKMDAETRDKTDKLRTTISRNLGRGIDPISLGAHDAAKPAESFT